MSLLLDRKQLEPLLQLQAQ